MGGGGCGCATEDLVTTTKPTPDIWFKSIIFQASDAGSRDEAGLAGLTVFSQRRYSIAQRLTGQPVAVPTASATLYSIGNWTIGGILCLCNAPVYVVQHSTKYHAVQRKFVHITCRSGDSTNLLQSSFHVVVDRSYLFPLCLVFELSE